MENSIEILLVEDSKTQALKLKMMLQKFGYKVHVENNGLDAFNSINKFSYPIVITDWEMPIMDGNQLCRKIRNNKYPNYIYILMQTTKDSKEDVLIALESGADDYLIKPIHMAELKVRLYTAKRIIELENTMKKQQDQIKELLNTDVLTEVFNRRYLESNLPIEIKKALRYKRDISVVMCDIDFFKNVNDTFGHQAGDFVLKTFAYHLKSNIRNNIDWVSRYGGEEFVIVLPETNLSGAITLAEKIRNFIENEKFTYNGNVIKITASFGVSNLKKMEISDNKIHFHLLKEVDNLLYKAKKTGRNKVVSK